LRLIVHEARLAAANPPIFPSETLMNKAFLIGVSLAATLATPALAQRGQPEGDLRRADVQTRLTERLGQVDINHDGTITQSEINTVVQMMQANGAPAQASERVQAMFARSAQNGQISVADTVQRQLAAFDLADVNHDGIMSAAERQAAVAAASAAAATPAPTPNR
jgi:hypothetical protein